MTNGMQIIRGGRVLPSLTVTGNATVGGTLGVTGLLTASAGINLGTAQTINATTSQKRSIGGTVVETVTAGGVALARTAGNILFSGLTTTSGKAIIEFGGFAATTNPVTVNGGGAIINLANLDTTANNYTGVFGMKADRSTTNAGIAFINESDATNAASVELMTRPASGALTRVVNIGNTGNLTMLTGYIIPLITDTDGTVEGSIWYDASEDKLKFKTAAGVETLTSA